MNKIFDGKRYWLLDGAMGTMLQKSGLKLGERPDLLSITHPDVVERINRAYVEAGSDLICANTFGSTRKSWLAAAIRWKKWSPQALGRQNVLRPEPRRV